MDQSSSSSSHSPELSSRGIKATKPPLSYFAMVLKSFLDAFDSETNPDGYICMTVAENKLTFKDIIAPKLVEIQQNASEMDFDHSNFPPFYGSPLGFDRFRNAIASYMNRKFLKNNGKYDFKINPDKLITLSGCGAVLDLLAWMLAESKESVIVPAPYYPAFDNDLNQRADLHLEPAYLEINEQMTQVALTEKCLADAYKKCPSKVKVLLLTNPMNPLGRCHTKDELKMAVRWARANKMFIVCDEIYAQSLHSPESNPSEMFHTIFDICLEVNDEDDNEFKGRVGDDIIQIYGFSKDFCLSGSRVGIVYTENLEMMKAFGNLGYFSGISTFTQNILTQLLEDEKWVDDFLDESRKRLHEQSIAVAKILTDLKLPLLYPTSAMFLIADFRHILNKKYNGVVNNNTEMQFFKYMAENFKILVTPGQDCHFKEPGFYRFCYAFVTADAVPEIKKRLTKLINDN